MPKIDPVTGCEVMTNAEFWNSEAQKEGKNRTGADIMSDFYSDMEEEFKRYEKELREPEKALEAILEAFYPGDENEDEHKRPVKVLEVHDVKYSGGIRHSSSMIKALGECKDGVNRIFVATSSYDNGSMIDPPNTDYNCEILEVKIA
jgi:hypothetical protein